MTKLEIRKKELKAHYAALEKLAKKYGVKNPDGKKLSVKLLHIERKAHHASEDYCNGLILSDQWDSIVGEVEAEVYSLFNGRLRGFFVNGDPRGYALKIKDDILKSEYADIGLQRDWGGYGLLAPEIE